MDEVEISPEKPVKGDVVKVLVKANPNEELTVSVSFEKVLPVSEGRYEYRLSGVNIPSTPNSFTVRAVNVKNLYVSVKVLLLFWVTKGVEAKNGVAAISQGNVPAGTYDVVIYGDAAEGASKVTIQITASTRGVTDKNGHYEYSYDTRSIPPGKFTVRVGGVTRTVTLYETKPSQPTQPPQELTSERIEAMTDEEAVQALNSIRVEKVAAILEKVSNGKAASILNLMERGKAAKILQLLTDSKAALIIEAMQEETSAEILQGLLEREFLNKTVKILCETSADKAAAILVEAEINPASRMLEEMIQTNVTRSAGVVERAVNMNLTKTAKIIESIQTIRAAELIIEIAR